MTPGHRIQPDTEAAEIDVTPLLDVVFILLIFFIVTASFVKESGVDANHLQSYPGTAHIEANEAILIRIEADNSIRINQRITDIRRVTSEITRLHSSQPTRRVVIVPSRAAYTETLVRVMDASREARVYDYSMTNTF